jgi:hypothetical protein
MKELQRAEEWVNENYTVNSDGEVVKKITKVGGKFTSVICKDDLIAAFIAAFIAGTQVNSQDHEKIKKLERMIMIMAHKIDDEDEEPSISDVALDLISSFY